MVVKNIPDLRSEWWWEEAFASFGSGGCACKDEIDWTEKLGGWDMMNLLKRDEDEWPTIWVAVDTESVLFS